MAKRRTFRKPVGLKRKPDYGTKVGTKRNDRRWQSPDGALWDSRYEYLVWLAFKAASKEIRRTDKRDTMAFTLPIRGGKCGTCGSVEVGQSRTYTPDFHVDPTNTKSSAEPYYVEAKGFLRPKERSLYRAFYKAHPDIAVRVLLQKSYAIGAKSKRTGEKSSIVDWFTKFLPNWKVAVWQGKVPNGW